MSSPIDTSASIPPPGARVPSPAAPVASKSRSAAVALTLLWPGAGHWYAGERERAIAFGGATLAAALLTLVASAAGFLATALIAWSLLDARHAAARASR
jgi:hypothetical protein